MRVIDLLIDVKDSARLGEDAHVAATIHLPDVDRVPSEPVVCFAKPGGGYSKGYYTHDLPGPGRDPGTGSQAAWHAERGWVFVSVDHLGVGSSTTHHDGTRLDYTTVAAANQAAEQEILRRLADGTIDGQFPPITAAVTLGIGQSMGGCLTIIQQGRYHCYDGIAILGYSAVHTHPPARPGQPPIGAPWLPRDTLLGENMVVLNAAALAADQSYRQAAAIGGSEDIQSSGSAMAWGFFYDDVDADLAAADVEDFPTRHGHLSPWASGTLPLAVAASCLTPGAVAPEAAAVTSPVLIAMGERDVIADPAGEARAYRSAQSVDVFICPRMGHMHNFAGTRELFWYRLETWAAWVVRYQEGHPSR